MRLLIAGGVAGIPAVVQAQTGEWRKVTTGGSASSAAAARAKQSGNTGAFASPTSTPLPRVYAPTRFREVAPRFPWKRDIVTTVFWIGEAPAGRNRTPNHKSSWDTKWQENFGGYDDPDRNNRSYDFRPKAFIPKLNPFYVALPFNDMTNPEIAKQKIPWYKQMRARMPTGSVCRGIWIAIRHGNKTCFAQWEDCGPFVTDDHEYVFGNARPRNTENNGAGLDVSPAVRDYLGLTSGARCDWRFCSIDEVPDGPWARYGLNNTLVLRRNQQMNLASSRYPDLLKQREAWLRREETAPAAVR